MADETQLRESAPPTKAGKDERREAIVAIAKEVFATNGYAGTSMSNIAARVGGSKATLYSYFKSKQELFEAVVEKKCELIERLLNEAQIESGGNLRAVLTHFGQHFLELILSEEMITTHRLTIAEAARFPEIGHTIYNSGVRPNHNRIAGFLEQAKQRGQLRSDAEATFAAEQFCDLCLSGLHRRCLWNVCPCPTAEEIRANVARAVEVFMRAYASAAVS
ncbi:MAG TPA: TetR/AcrR family transcriptional regulator [Rhizomicrobium sp.]|nr:TetR/AcrR family transcriptional regulator [Rhizomicrobium sp.]